jgi:hypothetical protein
MPIVYFDTAGTAASAGIFIPRDNIAGLTASTELASSEPEINKQCKFLAGFLATLQSTIASNRLVPSSLATALGFTVTKGNPIGVSPGIFNQLFTISAANVIDHSTDSFYPIPVPITGTNIGKGVLKITDVFPDAIAIASAGAISDAGILLPHSDINSYGAESATDPDDDSQSRKWFLSVARYLFDKVPARVVNTTSSAVITKTLGDIVEFTLADNALATTNPTTGLDPEKTTANDIYVKPILFNIQYLLNEQSQTFDVRIV